MEVLFGWSVPKHYPTAHKILPKHTPRKFFCETQSLFELKSWKIWDTMLGGNFIVLRG